MNKSLRTLFRNRGGVDKNHENLLILFFSFLCSFSVIFPLFVGGKSILFCAVTAIPFAIFIFVVIKVLLCISLRVRGNEFKSNLKLFCCVTGSLIAVWGIAFLVLFPGCLSTDSDDILKMIWGIPFESNWFRYDSINNHHPAFYIFLNFLAIRFGEFCGFGQMGCVSVATFMHVVTLACCCGFIACEVNNLFKKKLVVAFCWAFFFFNPLLIWYSSTVWKDVIFSGVFVCFALLLTEVVLRLDNSKRWKLVVLITLAVLSSLLRSNGFIAVGLSLLVACAVLHDSARKQMICSVVCVAALFFLITGPVYRVAGVAPAHFAETVGVPLQQISRTIYEDRAISKENEEYLAEILPLEEWKDSYNPTSSNSLKFSENFNDDILEADKLKFISCWVSVGFQHPGSYLRAWIAQTQNFWSLNSSTWYTVPAGYDVGDGQKSNGHLRGFLTQDDLQMALSSVVKALPFMYSIGFLAWLMLGGVLIAFLKRQRKSLIFFLPFVALWATFLLAAPASDFRYMFSLHLAFPLFILLAFWNFRKDKQDSAKANSEKLSIQ